jgi:hypothetical protein
MGKGLERRTVGVQIPGYTLQNCACTTTQHVLFGMFTVARRMVDLTKEYWNGVFHPSLRVRGAGNTPNPDVWCHRSASCITKLETEVLQRRQVRRIDEAPG